MEIEKPNGLKLLGGADATGANLRAQPDCGALGGGDARTELRSLTSEAHEAGCLSQKGAWNVGGEVDGNGKGREGEER